MAGKWGVGRGGSVVRKGGVSVKIKRQEPPNGGFGQGTVVCGRIHGEIPKRENTYPARVAKKFR